MTVFGYVDGERVEMPGKEAEGLFPAPPGKTQLIAHAADTRWRKETGGMIFNAIPVATDDRSKMMATGARVAAAADPAWSTVWRGADGKSYPVDARAMIAISDAMQAHVNTTFAVFALVKQLIEAGDITTREQIEAAFE